jgi:TatD DNase family protein
MLIDTHCHLDDQVFDADRDAQLHAALQNGVKCIVVPSVSKTNFNAVINLATHSSHCCFALGWHPMYINQAQSNDLIALKALVLSQINHPKLVAIGEIGLDYFVTKENVTHQHLLFTEQLKLARAMQLPVILHVRKAIDDVLMYLRRHSVPGGIAHAFNGSLQQAQTFIDLGFKLGFGGAMTYTRALKIRALAKVLPLEHIVLETDAPDIPPSWLLHGEKNTPSELYQIASVLAEIKGVSIEQVIAQTGQNAMQALPKLASLCTSLEVAH